MQLKIANCQEAEHYVNEYGVLECTNCEPLSESEYEYESDNSDIDPTYIPDSSSDSE